MVLHRDSHNKIWRISKLTGPNYRVWRVWLEMLLIEEGLWDVVSPATATAVAPGSSEPLASEPLLEKPLAAKGAQPETTESRESMRAKGIIWSLCAPSPLNRILDCDSAASCWEKLKSEYGPRLSRLPNMLNAFVSYAPAVGKGVLDMAADLNHLQDDIEEVCPEERPTDRMKTAVLVRAADGVVRAAGDKWWAVMWAMRGREYEEVRGALVILEEEEATKKRGSGEGNRGGRKRSGRRQ
jgi:hypothetical protein